ncbi:MAG: hypothetical protein KF799_10075 [Bdellovibrionales bacterium]|nr:hypothetical protein [Bdellovibrionales bacterium]
MKSLLLCFAFLIGSPAFAYMDVLDTGEILPKGSYRLLAGPQFLTDHGGLNVQGAFDVGFEEEYGLRGLFGFGKTDIFAGGLFKWVPIPDVEGQPAVGLRTGILYAKDASVRDLTFRIEPLVSKKFALEATVWTPYASVPIGIRNISADGGRNRTDMSWQLVGGTQLQVSKWKKLQFMTEVGVDLDKALSHFSIAALLYFDEYGIAIE